MKIEPYELVYEERKLNKKKVFGAALIVATIIGLSIYSGVKSAEYAHEKQKEAQNQKEQAIVEQIRIEQEEEARKIEEQKNAEIEAKKKINENPFTEEQMQAIDNIYSAPEGEKRVFLTFDDGPTESVTPLILDLLKQENIKATFFVLGNRAKSNPELIRREYEEGHYIANHGYSHVYRQVYSSTQAVLDEYNYTESCLQEALNNPNYHSKVFRFPGGSVGGYYHSLKKEAKSVLKDNNITYLDWNCLSKDAEGANTKEQLLQNVIDTAGTKSSVVVLMHDAADKILTYETLPDVINYFRENGYTFKNLYDIL